MAISKILNRLIRWYYHCDIPYCVNLEDVYFFHKGFDIVINPNSIIGRGTKIQHGVTIGSKEGEFAAPTIGKNCYIGAKAIIIGNIAIGDNCKIGAGAVVLKDIPSNCTAAGIPAKIISHENSTKINTYGH